MSFLFLSKLLPLFIYPLGLSCSLLLLSLWLCFRRSLWTFLPILMAFLILVTTGNVRVGNSLITSLERQYLPQENMPQAEAIVVLGGATRNNEAPRVIPDMRDSGDRCMQPNYTKTVQHP
jgi:uncharacterized SAM-binding protein YcdF (DUF218 family)